MYWRDADIKRYMQVNNLLYPEFNRKLGFSFHSLAGKELSAIKRIYPQDYQRILKFFPEAEAGVLQYEAYKQKSGGK